MSNGRPTKYRKTLGRMYNWKMTSALDAATAEDVPQDAIDLLFELSNKFGDCGWCEGSVFEEIRNTNNKIAEIMGMEWSEEADFWVDKANVSSVPLPTLIVWNNRELAFPGQHNSLFYMSVDGETPSFKWGDKPENFYKLSYLETQIGISLIPEICASMAFTHWMIKARELLTDAPPPEVGSGWFNHTRDDGVYNPCPKCVDRAQRCIDHDRLEKYAWQWLVAGELVEEEEGDEQTHVRQDNSSSVARVVGRLD